MTIFVEKNSGGKGIKEESCDDIVEYFDPGGGYLSKATQVIKL